jgi:uncharacterized protein YydD (DUF2326 family)
MRLLQLSANKASFKTIPFNHTGISLIVAKQKTDEKRNTYNSVGKSLAIALVHFCLGSNPIKDLEDKLPNWIFCLDFEIRGRYYTAKRSTSNQGIINLDGQEIKLDDYRDLLGVEVFGLVNNIQYLKFRPLLSRFIRPKRNSYDNYYNCIAEESDYSRLLNTSYLLGLDISKIIKKCELKDEADAITKFDKSLQSDPIVQSFFVDGDDGENIKLKIVELQRKIADLQYHVDNFIIAQDYNEIKKEADKLSSHLQELRNQAAKFRIAISNIDKSLQIKSDITEQQLRDFFCKAQVELNDMIVKRLSEVEEFNGKLLGNREKSLLDEKAKFTLSLADIESQIDSLGKQEDEKLQYLKSHGALDDYVGLTEQLNAYKNQCERLSNFEKMLKEHKARKAAIKKEMAEEDEITERYLTKIDEQITDIISYFQILSEQFYKDKTAGISIENNTGANKSRFNIEAKIADDAGDGVNGVKTFCFDWTLLKKQLNHHVQFIFHDSRLVSDIDTRQIATALKIAYKECIENGFQYILTINQNILDNLRLQMGDDFDTIVTNNEVLELTDESNEGKLLGIQVDLDYGNR